MKSWAVKGLDRNVRSTVGDILLERLASRYGLNVKTIGPKREVGNGQLKTLPLR